MRNHDTTSGHGHGLAVRLYWGRVVVSGVVAALLALIIAAGSPDVHAHVHADAGHANHVCAITLAAAGFCDTSAPMPCVVPGRLTIECRVPAVVSHTWATPAYWLIPAQAPPARAS